MATCQAVSAVLPQTVHNNVLFFWCPRLQEKSKAQFSLEKPLHLP
jgi:hypothetical protein